MLVFKIFGFISCFFLLPLPSYLFLENQVLKKLYCKFKVNFNKMRTVQPFCGGTMSLVKEAKKHEMKPKKLKTNIS